MTASSEPLIVEMTCASISARDAASSVLGVALRHSTKPFTVLHSSSRTYEVLRQEGLCGEGDGG